MNNKETKLSFTDNQRLAIEHDKDSDIVVSASAGAGKTAVLIEYIFRKVAIDKNTSIKDILAMTFTDAAAQSMKKKLFQRMNKDLTKEAIELGYDEDHLKKEAELLPSADICTIDSFCTNILNQYCYVIGWDPSRPKTVLDKNTVNKMKYDVAHDLVIEKLKEENKDFYDLVSAYSDNGNNTYNFEKILVQVSDGLDKYASEDKWYKIVEDYYDKKSADDLPILYQNHIYDKLYINSKAILDVLEPYYETIKVMDTVPSNVKKDISQTIDLCSSICELSQKMDKEVMTIVSDLTIKTPAALFDDKNLSEAEIEMKEFKATNRAYYDEVVSPNNLNKKVVNEIKEISLQYKTFSDQNKELKPKIELFLNLLKEYRKKVESEKQKLNGIDFVDMEKAAIEILKDKDIAERLRKKYKYILIDEYQDSNDIQETLVQLICNKDKGNVFRVGDVKQSIYGFRSSKPSLMRNIIKNAKKDEKVIFEDNFRSSDNIIQFNNLLYKTIMNIEGYNDTYLDDVDVAKAGSEKQHNYKDKCETYLINLEKKEGESKINTAEYKKDQSYFIVSKIKKMREESIKRKEDLKEEWKDLDKEKQKEYFYDNGIYADWKDYVILVRNHDFKKILQEAFDAYEVPVFFITNKGYYDDVAVQTVISWLKWIFNVEDEIAMYSVLTSQFYEWSNNQMAQNYLEFKENKEEKNIQKYIFNKNENIKNDYENLKKTYDNKGLIPLIQNIFNLNDFFHSKTTVEQRDNLSMFFEKCVSVNDRYSSLETLLDWLEISEKADDGTATSISESSNVVRIVTTHNSKGLEYPVVFYVGGTLKAKGGEKGRYRMDEDFGLALEIYKMPYQIKYKPLLWSIIDNKHYQEAIEEEIRLMYVATTRAMFKLVIVAFEDIEKKMIFDKKHLEMNAGAMSAIGNIIRDAYQLNEDEMQKYCEITHITKEDIDREEYSLEKVDSIEYKVPKYKTKNEGYIETSPSSLEKKKVYPISYKEKTDGALRGTLIHKAYELLDFKDPKIEDLNIPLDDQDKKKIMNFFNHDIGKKIAGMDNIIHELPYASLEDKEYMHGYMDLVAMNDEEIILVDYKSDIDKKPEKFVEDYKEQQNAYRKALEHLGLPITCYLYALELDEFIEIK